jgi:hypothetical protein
MMNETFYKTFDADWKKAVLFVHLLQPGLPQWAAGRDGWKALAALTGWPEERCQAAFEEAARRGLIETDRRDQN